MKNLGQNAGPARKDVLCMAPTDTGGLVGGYPLHGHNNFQSSVF
jgi:hypothetical protein